MQFATTPLSISQIWSHGFRLVHRRLLPMFSFFLLLGMLTLAVTFDLKHPEYLHQILGDGSIFVKVIMIILLVVISLVTYSTVLILGESAGEGQLFSLKQAVISGIKKLPKVLLAYFALALIFIFIGLIDLMFFAFCMFVSVLVKKYTSIFLAIILVITAFLGLLYLIFLNFYIIMGSYFCLPNFVVAEMRFVVAIKNTFSLVKGQRWRTFIVMALPSGILLFLGLLQPGNGYTNFAKPFAVSAIASSGSSIMQFALLAIVLILQAYFALVSMAILLTQWHDLKVRRQLKGL